VVPVVLVGVPLCTTVSALLGNNDGQFRCRVYISLSLTALYVVSAPPRSLPPQPTPQACAASRPLDRGSVRASGWQLESAERASVTGTTGTATKHRNQARFAGDLIQAGAKGDLGDRALATEPSAIEELRRLGSRCI
jgi:hypothetical protein